jgi:hypothetical protein
MPGLAALEGVAVAGRRDEDVDVETASRGEDV